MRDLYVYIYLYIYLFTNTLLYVKMRKLYILTIVSLSTHTIALNVSIGKATIEYVGKSGQFKYCPTDCHNGFVKFKMSKIQEITEDGNHVAWGPAIASQDHVWIEKSKNVSGTNALEVSFETTFSAAQFANNDVKLNFSTLITPEKAEILYGNDTIIVPANALKFTVRIFNWPFHNNNNKLLFSVTTSSSGDNEVKKQSNNSNIIEFGNNVFLKNEDYALNDKNEPLLVKSTINGNDITWEFPYFDGLIEYDPILSDEISDEMVGKTNSDKSNNLLFILTLVITIIAIILIFILLILYYFLRKKRKAMVEERNLLSNINP